MKTALEFYQVDAFTTQAFEGNPAGVVMVKQEWPNAAKLQKIAREINASETAFIKTNPRQDNFDIRFFTPTCEIPLCGHATLASAHVIFTTSETNTNQIDFKAKDTHLQVKYNPRDKSISLEFPQYSLIQQKVPTELSQKLNLEITELYKADHNWKLAICTSETALKNLSLKSEDLIKMGFGQLILTAASATTDFVYRCFVPDLGIAEDPVTGSAQCALMPYWSNKLESKQLASKQLSGRDNQLKATLNKASVSIIGKAKTVIKGQLYLD